MNIKKVLGGAMLAVSMAVIPVAASASELKATNATRVHIDNDGIVRVVGAEVTSISGNIINAVTRFKNNLVNWAFTTNASTSIQSNNSLNAPITDVRVGDKINVTGALSTIGSTLTVNATKVRDITTTQNVRVKTGTVNSVNTANNSFVLKWTEDKTDKFVTVQNNASTTIYLANGTVGNINSLVANGKVHVAGLLSADGTVLTASKVLIRNTDITKKEDKKNKEAFNEWKKGRSNRDHKSFFANLKVSNR